MSTSAHSPLPWRVGEWSSRFGGFEILDANGEPVAVTAASFLADGTMVLTSRAADRAILIVSSVNAHASLVGRVKELEKALRRLIGAVEACAVAERGGPPVNWEAVDASQDSARAALAAKEPA